MALVMGNNGQEHNVMFYFNTDIVFEAITMISPNAAIKLHSGGSRGGGSPLAVDAVISIDKIKCNMSEIYINGNDYLNTSKMHVYWR